MKDKKGITLIALVITIVVIIILALVTLNLTLGKNGIIGRARTAKEKYSNDQEYEKSLSIPGDEEGVASDRSEKESNIIKNITVETEELVTSINIDVTVEVEEDENVIGYHAFAVEKDNSDNIYTTVTENNHIKIKNLPSSTDYKVYVIAYDKYNNYKKSEVREVSTNNKQAVVDIADNDIVSYFGKQVNYNGDNNWVILYIGDEFAADGRHMYLMSKTARATGKPTTTGANYNNTVLKQASGQNLLAWAKSYATNNGNSNGAEKTWNMLTASNYSTYCDNNVAEWAIGGPTVDIYFKAYNLKKGTSIGYKTDFNSTGYNYTMGSGLTNEFNLNNLYFWFASPGSYGNGWVQVLSGSGTWCLADKDGNDSFHPVVCLKKTVKIHEENDIYYISP